MPRQKLSVVVLTKNEEKNIGPCLESVKWADEIIVIDDESCDKTVETAKRYTDKVISNRLEGNFAKQRNVGINKASGDWILQMDADERVTEGLRDKIAEILEKGSGHSAFTFRRSNIFCGKPLRYGGEDNHRPLRLFKRGKARFSGAVIHETLEVDGPIGGIDAVMEHYNFPTIGHYVETQNFYSGLEALQMLRSGRVITEKELKREMTTGPLKLFFKIYFKKQGFRDGINGLVFAVLSAWRRFLIYAKYWELAKR